MKRLTIIILYLSVLSQAYEIPCQWSDPPPYRSNISFILNEQEELVSTIYPEVNMIIDSRDSGASAWIKRHGNYPGIERYLKFVKQGDVVLNIGSHIGFQGMLLGKIIGPQGKIYFFEPYLISRNILIKNIYINSLNKISTVYPIAASNKRYKTNLIVALKNTGASEVINEMTSQYSNSTQIDEIRQVQVDLVDNVLPQNVVANFALIDVQYLDVQCLEGMKKTIERSPDFVILTQWTAYSKNMPRDEYLVHLKQLLIWFQKINYKFWRLDLKINDYDQQNCKTFPFLQMSKEDLLKFTDQLYEMNIFIDIVFAPGTVDPNSI